MNSQYPFKPVHKQVEHGRHSQTQLSGLFRLVIMSTFPAAFEMGIATQTVRGTARFLLIVLDVVRCRVLDKSIG